MNVLFIKLVVAAATTNKDDYEQLCEGWNRQTSCGNIGKNTPKGLTFTHKKVYTLS